MRFRVKSKRVPAINIVSLIDILVLLLIFFIVTTTFKSEQPSVQIKLPESKSATASAENDQPTIIHVSADNEIFLEDTKVQPADLAARMIALKQTKPAVRLTLKADEKADFGTIVRVLDAFKEAGVQNIPAFTAPVTK